jgi:hypothetical protein
MAVRNDFAPGEVLAAADLNDTFASRVPFAFGTATPTTTTTGFLWYDTNFSPPVGKVWNGSAFVNFSQGPADFSNAATGTYTDGGVDYKYLTFTASGTATMTRAGFADVLIVAGGGGGGGDGSAGQGGSAGGYLYFTDFFIPSGSLTVTVGAGGAGNSVGSPFNYGTRGVDSVFQSIYAIGGGAASATTGGARAFGGSCGAGGLFVPGQGTQGSGAQGGGSSNANGTGTANSITGTSVTRAAGKNATTGGAGAANSGDGGQGGTTGFNGGSGVVIIRVKV